MTFQQLFFDTYTGKFLQTIPFTIAPAIIFVVLRYFTLKNSHKTYNRMQAIKEFIFVGYIVGLFILTALPSSLIGDMWYFLLFKGIYHPRTNFFTFTYNIVPDFYKHFGSECVGNIFLYLPLGFLFPTIKKYAYIRKTILLGLSISICIEISQLFTGRSCDINDIIMNTFGTLLGFLLYKIKTFLTRNTKIIP